MTVIKITVIHSKGYNQITMGIETLRNIVMIRTDIFAVQNILKYSNMRAYLESRNHLKGSRWEQRCQWSKDAVKLVGILTQRQMVVVEAN